MAEPIAYYTEWSQSDREWQISYVNAYLWNLESWYWWSYFQGNKGDAGIKDRLLHTEGEGEGETIWESNTETHIFRYNK